MTKKISPYTEFKNWLFNPVPNAELDEWVIKAINKRAVLSSLCGLDGVTIYLNKVFNSFYTMALDDIEFYNFIRNDIIKRFRVRKDELTFIKHEKKDKTLRDIHRHFPMLKSYEVKQFMEDMKHDSEYAHLCEALGISTHKKKKMTKKDKKEYGDISIDDYKPSNPEPKTFQDLVEVFNRKVKDEDGILYIEPNRI